MSNQLIIRSVAPTDFAQWQPLWEGYNLFYGRAALPTEITQRTWSRFFDAYEPVHAMVAEKGGQLLGLVHYLFHRSTIQIAPTCYLQDLFTNEAQARLRLRLFGEKTIVSRERSTGESIYPEGNVLEGGRVSIGTRAQCNRAPIQRHPLNRISDNQHKYTIGLMTTRSSLSEARN